MIDLDTALYEYHHADAARRLATKLTNEALLELLKAMGTPLRCCTVSVKDEGAVRLSKRDVDTTGRLSPSQRARMRLLRATLKQKEPKMKPYDYERLADLADLVPPETNDARMRRINPLAYAQADDTMRRIDRGELVDGYNSAACEADGCTEVIEWENTDDGPENLQPQGLKCEDHWVCNEHAIRSEQCCIECMQMGAP